VDKVLLDTDTLSEILKGKNAKVAAAAAAYQAAFNHYTFSTITVVEIISGYQRRGSLAQLGSFLATLPLSELLTLDLDSAVLAGQIAGRLESIGQPIGLADTMIAAIALQHQLTLATGNQAYFQRVQALGYSLKLENWRV
jgi:tRNA(fMet)-specific endonuclease VapC